jgi:flagellar hook-length control protein FliK
METTSVAPLPGPVLPQPASQAPANEEGAKPFGQTLKEELAKPEADKAEAPQTDDTKAAAKAEPEKAAEAPRTTQPARTPEWAALLERAGLSGETEPTAEDDSADGSDLAPAAEAAAETLIAAETEPNPLHPLIATPASARTGSTEAALDRQRTAAPVEAKVKAEALDALAARAAANDELQGSSAKADGAAADALLGSFADRLSASENAFTSRSPALDALASTGMTTRWAAGQATAANAGTGQTTVTARIETPLGANGWGEAFQQKIVWLVDRQQQSAELHINPPHLGPVEVSLSMGDEGTHVAFSSPHAAVREAIEASLADLKTALGEKGLSLGQATVGADSQAAREQLQGEARAGSAGGRNGGAGEAPAELPLPQRVAQRGLVDIFA